MKFIKKTSGYMVVVAFALLASVPSVAAPPPPPTVTFNLTGIGSGANLAGVYTSPYQGNINGGVSIAVTCDDFADNSFNPESWTAYQTSLSSISTYQVSGDDQYLKWKDAAGWKDGSGDALTQVQAYTVAAILDLDILQAAPGSENQEDLSFALWDLFDSTAGDANWGGTSDHVSTWPGLPASDLSAAQADVTTAIGQLGQSTTVLSGYNVTLYSYVAGTPTSCGTGSCPPPPQEFIAVTPMPEASSLATFAFYLLVGGGGLLVWGRRHLQS